MLSVVYLRSETDPATTKVGLYRHEAKAEQRGVDLSELLTEVLKRDIDINEALK